jgi:hypothetical protein
LKSLPSGGDDGKRQGQGYRVKGSGAGGKRISDVADTLYATPLGEAS